MEKLQYGDITTLGITPSGYIRIEFYDPDQITGDNYSSIYLTTKQVDILTKIKEIINGE